MTNTDITPTKLVINCVNRDQWNQAKIENRIEDDEVWVVSPDEQLSGFNKRIVEVLDPVERTDAATKNYVDNKIDLVEADIQTKQPLGDYLTPSTTLADLENTPGFQTSEEVDQKIAAAPFQPIGDYVTTDNDYVTESDVSRVVDQAKIRKLWNENLNGYTDSDGNIWQWSDEGSTYVDKFARLTDLGNVKELFSDDGKQKILGNGEVWRDEESHWTDWEFEGSPVGSDPVIAMRSEQVTTTTLWYWYQVDNDGIRGTVFTSEEECANITSDTFVRIEDGEIMYVASRTWIEGGFKHIDDLALKSEIPEPGISEDEARTLIQSYDYVTNAALNNKGFRTQEQVESQITAKGYRTESQVNSQIEAKGYRTEQQVNTQIEAKGYVTSEQAQQIAAETLPTGYAQTEVIGTLEDDTEVHFYILTKEI